MIITFFFIFWGNFLFAQDDLGIFTGRVSRLNPRASLMRIRVNFENAKFLKKLDKIEFWNDTYPSRKCLSYLQGRSERYLLLKVPSYKFCIQNIHMTTGAYLHFESEDLKKSIEIATELMEVLHKKKLALEARKLRNEREVDAFIERQDLVNKRYEILRQKLELEWQKELTAIEKDKVEAYKNFKHSEARLEEVEHKLQQYRINEQNLKEDRWSLDPKLYYKK